MFRGREMAHTEFGREVLVRVASELEEIALVESDPKQEGRNMIMILSPKPEVVKKMKDAKAAKMAEEKKKKDEEKSAVKSE